MSKTNHQRWPIESDAVWSVPSVHNSVLLWRLQGGILPVLGLFLRHYCLRVRRSGEWHDITETCGMTRHEYRTSRQFNTIVFLLGSALCSPVPMFPGTYVPRTYVPRYLCSPVPMFPGTDVPRTYVPRYPCSPVPMFPKPMFPGTYVPRFTSNVL